MKFKSIAPLGATLFLVLAAPAMAQDDAGSPDWTGPYVGGSLGYNWLPNNKANDLEQVYFDTNGDGQYGDIVQTPSGGNAFAPGFCDGKGTSATTCSSMDREGKAAWSAMAGYDMQMGSIVVGGVIEGGQSYGTNYVTGFSTTPASYTLGRRLDWEAAARLRAGFALNRTLIYATGGLAYGKFKNSFQTTNALNSFTENNKSEGDWGYTVGGGIDHKISDNFSIGVLYRYTRFNPNDYTVTVTQGSAPATNPFVNPATTSGQTVISRSNEQYTTQSVRVTAAFRF
ncbi:outer membrane protein [Sphingobium sp.]|uniref:outer membrane protein n=1 Tax=Sphingobium sp. TaxID=1912891 RepID=UPI002C96A46B|nr:outer membrane beta-barrel protein [Sphingobium sp.]HUD95284.1 outer membrane beta-barrel protein [Sphingobium sp.]